MGKPAVLVVDDSEFFARSLVLVLESMSQPALAATSALQALAHRAGIAYRATLVAAPPPLPGN